MSDTRITRNQAALSETLRQEVEDFNPFVPRKEITREEGNTSGDSETLNSFSDTIVNSTEINFVEESKPKLILPNLEPERNRNVMANQVVTLKDALKVVPEFDGENIPLSMFFEGCDEAKVMIGDDNEENLTRLLRSKITGEARKVIHGQNFSTVEELKDYIKTIYVPAKTVHQLQGELGNEFQRDNETVISFANRIRDLGRRIVEAQKVNAGRIEPAFKAAVESNARECFKRGLKPEIENKLEDSNDLINLFKNAIKAERILEAQKALRNQNQSRVEIKREEKKRVYTNQIQNDISCQLCKKIGHTAEKCYSRQQNSVTCQLCNRFGHSANQCRNQNLEIKCQLCNKNGHSARQCQSSNNKPLICQNCNKVGHMASNCYQSKFLNSNDSRAQLNCQICKKIGHTATACRFRDNSNEKFCNYCKTRGHVFDECRKRQINAKSGNGQGVPQMSAKVEAPKVQTRSTNVLQMDDLLQELLPLD